jgi:hypothetical protein
MVWLFDGLNATLFQRWVAAWQWVTYFLVKDRCTGTEF